MRIRKLYQARIQVVESGTVWLVRQKRQRDRQNMGYRDNFAEFQALDVYGDGWIERQESYLR